MPAFEESLYRMSTPQVSWRDASRFWWKLGFISFGGPAGQIALMHAELVERRRWISEQRFLHALNYCMLLPGPEAQQLATYLGWLMHRTWGGIVAGALFVLPSWFVLAALSYIYVRHGEVPWIAAFFAGIKPAVMVVVMAAALRVGRKALKKPWMWLVAITAFVGLVVWHVSFPLIVLGAGLTGWLIWKVKPDWIAASAGHGPAKAKVSDTGTSTPAHTGFIFDDHTPLPEHARWQTGRALRVLCMGLLAALVPLGALAWLAGPEHVLTRMGVFFSQAALVTFGGAYAVLPYVQQAAVETFGWLSAGQMIDGMALGETTPGPLIMVVSFVGFVGGWAQQALGADHVLAGALLASAVATWFTFLPSFVFILAGAPWVEVSRGKLGFAAPLQGITAAVVGVMAHLALYFAQHSVWLEAGGLSVPALVMALMAAGMLWGLKQSIARTLLACGALGVVAHALGWMG
jgi:chromate transporter